MQLDRRLFALLKSRYLELCLSTLAGTLAGVIVVLQARLLSLIVDSVYLQGESIEAVFLWLQILLLMICIRGILIWAGDYAASNLAIKITGDLRLELIGHLTKLGPRHSIPSSKNGSAHTGEIIQVVNQGVEELRVYFGEYIPQLALSFLVPVTVLIFILPVDLLTAAILLITAPLIPLFMILIGDRAKKLTERQWVTLSRMSAYYLDVIQGLATLKIFGRSKDQIQVIKQIGERYRSRTMEVLRVTFLSALALEWLSMLSLAVIAVEIGLRLLYGRLEFQEAFFILLLAPEFYLPLRLLGSRFHAGMAGVAAAGKIFSILEQQPIEDSLSSKKLSTQLPTPGQSTAPPSIELKEINFGYEANKDILPGVSFHIPAGKMTALVGPSGAGKSTIVDLLLRFIQPAAGQVLIDRVPLEQIPMHSWMENLAWVSQEPFLFNTTILENIQIGNPDASEKEVIAAASKAYAHDFISQLPEGYQTMVGERGSRLSAGEAQRIGLARAFLKQAPLVILDEATANLDPLSVQEIQLALNELLAGRTSLVIAHNLGIIQRADQIIVLEQGTVVESGSHAQLLASDGLYSRMVYHESHASTAASPDSQRLSSPYPKDLELNRHGSIPQASDFSFSTLRSLLHMLAPFKWRVILSIMLGWGTVMSGVGLLATSAYLISTAALQVSIAVLQVPIVGVRTFGITRGLFRYLERYISHDNTFRLVNQIRTWFYRSLEPLAPARLQQFRSGDLLNRVRQDTHTLEDFYVRVIAPPLVWVSVTIFCGALLGIFSPQLALILILFQVLAGFILPGLVRSLSHKPEQQLVQAQAELSANLVDGIQGMAEIRVFDPEGKQSGVLREINRKISTLQNRLSQISSLVSAGEMTLSHLASWVVLVAAIPLVEDGQLGGVYLGSIILITLASFEAAQPLPISSRLLERGLAAAKRLDEIVCADPQVVDPGTPLPSPSSSDLEFEGVSFAYTDQVHGQPQPMVIKDLSFKLPPGKHLAIVGPSGAGKSTIANLLLRFWEYRQGNIYLDRKQLKDYTQEDVRSLISVITQYTYLFNGTLGDNLRLANPGASLAQLHEACESAQLGELIASLPQEYQTWIGERGTRLSAGERQRLAIARALLKGAPILILDEATSALDTLVEQDLVVNLLENFSQVSMLWITHRLAGMPAMDEILVLEQGQVIERGSHEELYQQDGLYRQSGLSEHVA